MKLQQLRYLVEIAEQNLNITDAAEALYTSQPGISKQVRLLEQELGLEIFERNGKHIKRMTPQGEKIIQIARELLAKADNIKAIAQEFNRPEHGILRIATTNTQARYVLPEVIQRFVKRYPNVSLQINQGTPAQMAEQLESGSVDLAIITEWHNLFNDMVLLPCYHWNRSVIVPSVHPLINQELSIETLGQYPLVTYTFGFMGASDLAKAFNHHGIMPNIVFTAIDADVLKTYVRLGLGVGIIASMAHTAADRDLIALDASHLFNYSSTHIAFKRGTFLRQYMYDFIEFFAPHLTKSAVEKAEMLNNNHAIDQFFSHIELAHR
ncbi:HTH-type transcriptional regulator CysB [Spirabiliibacterium falconis]|uniref:HTH-type transcriptional regulator CysB n=1 Tax=Spirabiliibacterium falconis TaxID=572023 RepID=UPI001AAD695E|nr:HTH-type transcriptional regulator CysB [Spirabiliibacterium falconis]MBE2894156.1 HTH-type transcriptional regulator CysB [Spirabiliibacterium falconis]